MVDVDMAMRAAPVDVSAHERPRRCRIAAPRSDVLLAGVAALAVMRRAGAGAASRKVLRYAFAVAETSFDPAKINDLYSRTVTPHIFEAPLQLRPPGAAGEDQAADRRRHARGLATTSASGRCASGRASTSPTTRRSRASGASWSRQDYVYAIKRFADPAQQEPGVDVGIYERDKFVGLSALRQEALERAQAVRLRPRVEGLRALDRYTLQFKLEEPRPRFIDDLLPAISSAPWRARWSSSTATRSTPIRWAPARSS